MAQPMDSPQMAGADSEQSDGTLWIGDLLAWMDEEYLRDCFRYNGALVSAKVIPQSEGYGYGYGYLQFKSHAAAEHVLSVYNGSMMPVSSQNFKLDWPKAAMGTDDSSDITVNEAKVVTDRLSGCTKAGSVNDGEGGVNERNTYFN